MSDAQFTAISNRLLEHIRRKTPYDTGNLRNKATLINQENPGEHRIYVDSNIAPYFKYVNNYARMRNGGVNKNHKYFQNAVNEAVAELAASIKGEVIKK